MTALVEHGKLKKIAGVKTYELMIWLIVVMEWRCSTSMMLEF